MKIPGIHKALTKRQRAELEERIDEVPFMYRFAAQSAVETGYVPDVPAQLIEQNAHQPQVAALIDELRSL